MASTPKRLVSGSELTASAATYYTAPSNTKTRITAFTATNTNASGGAAETMTVHLIPSGGSAADSNMVTRELSVAAAETKQITGAIGQVLEAGGFIQAFASTTTSITIVVSGIEIT